jgi:hypothetical protein
VADDEPSCLESHARPVSLRVCAIGLDE